jgi:hypothetical protein
MSNIRQLQNPALSTSDLASWLSTILLLMIPFQAYAGLSAMRNQIQNIISQTSELQANAPTHPHA